jgi:hypothetical protein
MTPNEVELILEWQKLVKRWPYLREWRMVIDTRARERLGQCRYREKEIGISAWHVEYGEWSDVCDTLRHEVAHALAPVNAGHNWQWKQVCLVVGARPEMYAPMGISRRQARMKHAAKTVQREGAES